MSRRRGAMLVLIALMMIIFIATVAFSVDVAYMQLTRTKLRTATDAAARAAGEALTRLQDVDLARQVARDIAAKNLVAGDPLELGDDDIVFGHSTPSESGAWVFQPGGEPTNAVRVFGRRSKGSESGSVRLFFGGVLGIGEYEPEQTSTVTHLDRDICLVVDRSGSMAFDLSGVDWSYPPGGAYCEPPHTTLSRWAALVVAVNEFVRAANETDAEEQIGLVSYATAGTWCDTTKNASDIEARLSTSYRPVRRGMRRIGSEAIPGGTSISSGIDNGTRVLTDASRTRTYAKKTMVVLTDGHHNSGRSPLAAARDAAAEDIVIHTVTFSTGANIADMQAVAAATEGNHYHAPDAESLRRIFREIALTLPVLMTE